MMVGLAALAILGATAGCGRSAPEGAAGTNDGDTEPVMAGIEVVSEEPVIVPPSTTATVETTPTTTPPAAARSYVVEPGDTLSVIARQFNVSVDALSQANGITDVNAIKPGQELIIPG